MAFFLWLMMFLPWHEVEKRYPFLFKVTPFDGDFFEEDFWNHLSPSIPPFTYSPWEMGEIVRDTFSDEFLQQELKLGKGFVQMFHDYVAKN